MMMMIGRRVSAATTRVTPPADTNRLFTTAINAASLRAADHAYFRIPVDPDSVEILDTPSAFFHEMLELSKKATKRVDLASLYLGTESQERELAALLHRCLDDQSSLRVSCLFDYYRGLRGHEQGSSTLDLLAPMLEAHPDRAQLHLFRPPPPRTGQWWRARVFRGKLRELLGVFHSKSFVFDDNVLISGCNLGRTYFTNRQDRYVLVRNNRALADLFAGVCDQVRQVSWRAPTRSLDALEAPSKDVDGPALRTELPAWLHAFAEAHDCAPHTFDGMMDEETTSTFVVPSVQFGPAGQRHDEAATLALLGECDEGKRVDLATGYLNLAPSYERVLAARGPGHPKVNILAASKEAHGFFGGKGAAGLAPDVQEAIVSELHARLAHVTRLWEWQRKDWTFHGKGIWVSRADSPERVVCSMFGSPNYGRRSVDRDLETSLTLVTDDVALQERLARERDALLADCTERVSPRSDLAPWWAKLARRFVQDFM